MAQGHEERFLVRREAATAVIGNEREDLSVEAPQCLNLILPRALAQNVER
ncbi:hypothetical protein [Novosphingobium sp. CCH12-A3]|nr:hypothetical protein [Novosphingobium sp. CCH12-A3]